MQSRGRLLNIVPEHLDLHGGFDNYVRAKRKITRYQNADDILVYNARYPLPRNRGREQSPPSCLLARRDRLSGQLSRF